MAFAVGDKCVVPNLGVGVVRALEEMNIDGQIYRMYQIKILDNGMNYTCPVDQADANSLRAIIPDEAIERIYEVLKDRGKPADKQTWNRRYREYSQKIGTGDPLQIAGVLRDLYLLKAEKTLSFGERRMYDKAHGLIVQEIAAAKDIDEKAVEDEIRSLFM